MDLSPLTNLVASGIRALADAGSAFLSLLTDSSFWTNVAGSFVGALAGAGTAFLLEARRRSNENAETQRSRFLHAQFLFAQKINSIILLKNHLDAISPATSSIDMLEIVHITIDERISARDLAPMIDGRSAEQAFDILRCDRTYAEANDWVARFNRQKDLIASHPNTQILSVIDMERGQLGAKVDLPLVVKLNSTLANLRAAVENSHKRLPEGLVLLTAFMKDKYPGRRTLGVSPIKQEPANHV
jgi:hypothetical protein